MTDTENTIDVVELTARLGLPADQQSTVASWANAEDGHLWTEREADELVDIWWNDDTNEMD